MMDIDEYAQKIVDLVKSQVGDALRLQREGIWKYLVDVYGWTSVKWCEERYQEHLAGQGKEDKPA